MQNMQTLKQAAIDRLLASRRLNPPQQEAVPTPEKESGFSWLFLIPVVAAVAIAVPLVLKKRK